MDAGDVAVVVLELREEGGDGFDEDGLVGGCLTGGEMGEEVEEGVVVGIADVGAELDDDEGGQSSRTTPANNNMHIFQQPDGPDPWLDLRSKPIIDSVHNGLPRFGHSNRIGLLASPNGSHQMDYANGVRRQYY